MLKEKHALPFSGIFPVVIISFLFNFAYTLLSPVYPVFASSFVSQDAYVGYLVAGIALLTIIYNFVAVHLLKKYRKISVLKIGLIGLTVTFALLAFVKTLHTLIFIEVFRSFFLTIVLVPVGLLIREIASKKHIGRAEGLYFTVANIAWMIGPLIGGLLANAYSFQALFLISALFPFLAFIVLSYAGLQEHNHNHINKGAFFANFLDFAKSRNLRTLFLLSIGLLAWWSMIYTFIPLYIKEEGFGINIVGYVLFLVVLPLILLEVPAGNLADRFGYKKFFFAGFLLMSVLAIATYFFPSPFITLSLIIAGSIGAAFVEPLREAYFFENVKSNDEIRFYSIHRIAIPIGQLLGPLVFSTILLMTGFRFLFLFVGCLMFVFSMIALFLKERNEIHN